MNDAELIQLLESFGDLPDDVEGHLFVDFSSSAESL